jgi:uncharacterized repeat protein (TIGR03943 family)
MRQRSIGLYTQGALLLVMAVMGLRLSATDAFAKFVRPGMKAPLLIASIFIGILGAATIRISRPRIKEEVDDDGQPHGDNNPSCDSHDHGASHGHGHGSFVSWLVAAPCAVLILVAPTSLGSYAASRSATRSVSVGEDRYLNLVPIVAGADGVVRPRVSTFVKYALYDANESLKAQPVELVGFVTRSSDAPGGYFLTRFSIACCASDAYAVRVALRGPLPTLANDTWISVQGTWRKNGPSTASNPTRVAELDMTAITVVAPPEEPYER